MTVEKPEELAVPDRLLGSLQPYLDSKTGLPLGMNGGRDNLIKDAAVACALSSLNTIPSRAAAYWRDKVSAFVEASKVPGYPALLYREPGNLGRNSVDNLIGAVVATQLCGLGWYSQHAWQRAWAYSMTFSVQHPEVRFSKWNPWSWKAAQDWYGRFPGIRPFLKAAQSPIGLKLSDAELTAFRFCCGVTCADEYENTSDKILLWLQFQVLPWQKDPDMASCYMEFRKEMGKQYPGGPRELLAVYYGTDHPFSQHADQTWGIIPAEVQP